MDQPTQELHLRNSPSRIPMRGSIEDTLVGGSGSSATRRGEARRAPTLSPEDSSHLERRDDESDHGGP
jgi:hypothetical protein